MVLCEEIDAAFAELETWQVDDLTEYATTLRYGEDFFMPDEKETRRAIRMAERVWDFVMERLRKRGFTS